MNNKPRVMLDLPGIALIVMNTVAVEGHCGIAKQQDRINRHLPFPIKVLNRTWGRNRCRGRCCRTVDKILNLADRNTSGCSVVMLHRNKTQRASSSSFPQDFADGRNL